ncbi:tubulin-like doman-containing protein [Blautia obeum]|uniref:tubulin-like doman-containing protein n=1 Tax=Blautia obeum TaxID=40520 RepID=UPI001D092E4B|nr:tubulin-like doman-containing protein [Blautia obeum]MCB7341849.1 tubulin-like doman-containing protein [Blautia obeum]
MPEKKSKADLQKMLQVGTVDVGNETLFGNAVLSEPNKQKLTLVISTGGSGMAAIDTAMRIADQKLKVDYKNFVKFIIVDSDTGQVEDRQKKGVNVLNISTPGAQERFALSNRSSYFKNVMPEQYDIKLLNPDGASQDRMTGLIKFFDRSQDGSTTNDAKFREMIAEIFARDWAPYGSNSVDIMILSGLSGGNGSGTFINLAVAARQACPMGSDVRVYGYLMLPDTARGFAQSDSARSTLYRNGFAALKELESYMSMGFNLESETTFKMPDSAKDVTVSAGNAIFDYPVLISGDYGDAVEMVGETIVNFIADSQGSFDQRSFYSNVIQARQTYLSANEVSDQGILKPYTFPEDSHMYSGIGYAHASIPEKIVIPNIIGKVCHKLYVKNNSGNTAFCTVTQHLSAQDFDQQIRKLLGITNTKELNKDALWDILYEELKNAVVIEENDYDVTRADLINGDVRDYIDGFKKEKVRLETTDKMIAILRKHYEAFKTTAELIMKDFGPRAMEYLYNGEGDANAAGVHENFSDICLKTMMATVTEKFINLASTPGKYPGTIAHGGFLHTVIQSITKEEVDSWKGEVYNAVFDDVLSGVAAKMNGVSGSWKREYTDSVEYFVSECIRFADILETMMDYYTGEGKSLDAVDFAEFARTTGERNGVNLCSNGEMYNWVKSQVSKKVNGVSVQDIKEELIDDFMAHSEDWISEEKGKARKRFDEVMSKCCKLGKNADVTDGLGLSITDYFNEVLKDATNPVQQQTIINNEVRDIMSKLKQSSKPSIKVRSDSSYTVNRTILIPQSLMLGQYSAMIRSAFNSCLNVQGAGIGNIGESTIADSIICYQASVGHAMAALQDLPTWENAYEKVPSISMHTCNGQYKNDYSEEYEKGTTPEERTLFGTGLSWLHYPSVNIAAYEDKENVFGISGNTTEAKYRRDVFDKKIEYALKEKIIECVKEGNKYSYFLNVIPDNWKKTEILAYKGEKGKDLFDFLAKQNPESTATYRKPIILTGSMFFEQPFDFTEIIAKENWTDERITKEHRAYMKRIMRKNTYLYKELEKTLSGYCEIIKEWDAKQAVKQQGRQAQIFCELYLYNVINCDEKQYDWSVLVNKRGGNLSILTFSRLAKAGFNEFDKKLCGDDLLLPIVYKKFCEMLKENTITLELMEDIKANIMETVSEKEFDEMVDERLEVLNGELQRYQSVLTSKDPVDDLLVRYKFDNDMLKEADFTCKFYEVAQSVAEANK